jgi:hypothetical protein
MKRKHIGKRKRIENPKQEVKYTKVYSGRNYNTAESVSKNIGFSA